MSDRWDVASLDQIEALPGPGSLRWRPVRAHFDVRAFGTNAYTAERAGDDVVEPHTEGDEGGGHQELYFVARGRARFTLDDESFDAEAGTYVFVRDPTVHRHALALEAGTTVLSFGGPPVFEPSGWEHYWLARVELRAGNTRAALDALRRAIEREPERAARAREDDTLAALRAEPEFGELTGGA